MTPKQLKYLDIFCAFAPRLNVVPSDPDVPKLLRDAAALQTAYLAQGEDAFRTRADELLQADKPRGIKIVELAMELAMAASFMGDDLSEAARHALWLADEFESLFTNKQER